MPSKSDLKQELRKSCVQGDLTWASRTTVSKFLGPMDTSRLLTFLRDDLALLHSHTEVHHIQPFRPNVHYCIHSVSGIKGPFSTDVWHNTQSHTGYPLLFRKKGVVCHAHNNLHNFLLCSTWRFTCAGTTEQLAISLAWWKQLCLTPGKDRNKNSSAGRWTVQTDTKQHSSCSCYYYRKCC